MTPLRPRGALPWALLTLAALLPGCDTARVVAPPPPLRAASASDFGIDLELAEPLDRASAEDASRYTVRRAPAGFPETIYSATVIDTFYGRVVQLLLSSGPLADTADFTVEARDLGTIYRKTTGTRSTNFRTGLGYRSALRDLFDSRCSSCHGGTQPAGNYRTDSYAALFGAGTDGTPNLIAGDPNCLVIRRCRPGRTMWDRGHFSYLDFEMLLNWVVSYGARL